MIRAASGLAALLLCTSSARAAEPLQVRFADGAGNACTPHACRGPAGSLLDAVRRAGGRVEGCYGLPVPALQALRDRAQKGSGGLAPDLSQCFAVTPPPSESAVWESRLRAAPGVSWTERPTPVVPAQMDVPDFRDEQFVFEDPPTGLGVRRFWALAGTKGAGRTVVDIEVALDSGHLELRRFRDVLDARGAGTPLDTSDDSRDHAVASLGIIVGADDGQGIDGMAPEARPYFFSAYPIEYTWGVGPALLRALGTLQAGDVVLIEVQRPGPMYDADMDPSGQWGMVPVEWARADFDAISLASSLGVTVVEPAGNGFQDLDDPVYEGRFDRGGRDSQALLVCAGNPPSGDFGPAREAMIYTNRGSRCDLQGYGAAIYTAGYGDAWGGPATPDRYTAEFAGTSAASPQVAGAAVLLQSRAAALGGYVVPRFLRQLLADTGTPGGRDVGPLPDLVGALLTLEAGGFVSQPPAPVLHPWTPCRAAPDCDAAPGLACVEVRPPERYCLPACEPFAPVDEAACGRGEGCALQVWGGGLCTPVEGRGGTGSPCTSELDCDLNAFCDPASGCQPICSVSRNAGCGAGETCLFGGGLFGDWGVCARLSPNPEGLDDGALCQQDFDCRGGLCFFDLAGPPGVCVTPGCRDDAECHGAMAECLQPPDGAIPFCAVPCQSDARCGAGRRCLDGICLPEGEIPACFDDTDCPDGLACVRNECLAVAECAEHRDCESGEWCRSGACRGDPRCGADADCRAAEVCLEGFCEVRGRCRADDDCSPGRVCREAACVLPPRCPEHRVRVDGLCVPDGTCEVQADCGDRYTCRRGRCERDAICASSRDCQPGVRCVAGRCGGEVEPPPPEPVPDVGVSDGAGLDASVFDATFDAALEAGEDRPASLQGGRGCGCRIRGGAGAGLGEIGPIALLLVLPWVRRSGRRRRTPRP